MTADALKRLANRAILCESEDEPEIWIRRTSWVPAELSTTEKPVTITRRAASRIVAQYWDHTDGPAWRLKVVEDWMRPHDCAVDHDKDERVDLDEEGFRSCGYTEDGWHHHCKPDHPAAIACWRVEPRSAPLWWRRARNAMWEAHPGRHRRSGLWGVEPERKSYLLDRLIVGRWVHVIPGGAQPRLHQGEFRYCPTCRRVTLHNHWPESRVTFSCAAFDHYTRMRTVVEDVAPGVTRPMAERHLRAVESVENRQEAP